MQTTLLTLVILTALLGLAAAEILSLLLDDGRVELRCEVNMRLTEPGETVTLSYRVRNTGFWPLFFVGFSFLFDEGVELRESEDWKAAHQIGGPYDRIYRFDAGLLPRRVLRGSIRFAFRDRGLHNLGRVYVETGDFLGFTSRVQAFELPGSLVCTARSLPESPTLEPLGGFLGEVSVRRFILEDPSLVLGYRDYSGTEPMKQISWTQTARTGRLTVKNHDFTADADVVVLVDLEKCEKPEAERCLCLARTVSDRLEAARIPYALRSNGDLLEVRKGVGRAHRFEVQRRIGLSRFVRYQPFGELAKQWAWGGVRGRGWIVIAPRRGPALDEALALLQAASDTPLCLLIGEEADRA